MRFCTVVARNYLAYARVLAHSLNRVGDGSQLSVLVLDDLDHAVVESEEPFDVLRPADLDIAPREFHDMAVDLRRVGARDRGEAVAAAPSARRRRRRVLPRSRHRGVRVDGGGRSAGAPARHRPDAPHAPRRCHATGCCPVSDDDPARRRVQPRLHRGVARRRRLPRVVVGAAAARVPRRDRSRPLRRPEVDRLRAVVLRPHRARRRRVQRRVLESLRTRREARCRGLRGQRPPAPFLPLQRLQPARAVPAEQVPDRRGAHPARRARRRSPTCAAGTRRVARRRAPRRPGARRTASATPRTGTPLDARTRRVCRETLDAIERSDREEQSDTAASDPDIPDPFDRGDGRRVRRTGSPRPGPRVRTPRFRATSARCTTSVPISRCSSRNWTGSTACSCWSGCATTVVRTPRCCPSTSRRRWRRLALAPPDLPEGVNVVGYLHAEDGIGGGRPVAARRARASPARP